jgi:hypothetical protein
VSSKPLRQPTAAEVRELVRLAREEGVLQLQTPSIAFTLGPKPIDLPGRELGAEPKEPETPEQRLERELFPEG